jgi:hypothetical protein
MGCVGRTRSRGWSGPRVCMAVECQLGRCVGTANETYRSKLKTKCVRRRKDRREVRAHNKGKDISDVDQKDDSGM